MYNDYYLQSIDNKLNNLQTIITNQNTIITNQNTINTNIINTYNLLSDLSIWLMILLFAILFYHFFHVIFNHK